MTKKKTATIQNAPAVKPPCFFIVNPRGAIHQVTKEHMRFRLLQPGYREATPEEVQELERRDGVQVFDNPICKPWKQDSRLHQAK